MPLHARGIWHAPAPFTIRAAPPSRRALRRRQDSGTVAGVAGSTGTPRLRAARTIATAALLLAAGVARAEPEATPEHPFQREMAHAVQQVIAQYGPDAANLEGHLLQAAIQGGSQLEASIGIAGFEEDGGRRHLAFELDTGIVFRDDEVPRAAQAQRLWTTVVEPALARCKSLDLRAEGVLLRLSYRHGAYADRVDLLRRVREGGLAGETVVFRTQASDVVDRANGRKTAAELTALSRAEINGAPVRLSEEPAPSPAAP